MTRGSPLPPAGNNGKEELLIMEGQRPLEGIKILDFTIYVAASVGSSVFGYLGADVVKIEPPKGDPWRQFGNGFRLPVSEEENPCFDAINCFKRDIVLNLRDPEGMAAMHRLIERADILITNYRGSALKSMGLTYEDVRKINPRIVYATNDGYGRLGPDAARPGFDTAAFWARSGLARAQAYSDQPPCTSAAAAGDIIASMSFTTGVLAAYIQAKATGVGCEIYTSLFSTALWVGSVNAVLNQYIPNYGSVYGKPAFLAIAMDYICSDGNWIRLSGQNADRYWPDFCKALGLEEYENDPRFNTSVAQCANATACFDLIDSKIRQKPLSEWIGILNAHDLPFELVNTGATAARDEQAIANGYVETIDYPQGGETYVTMPPMRISGSTPPKREKAAKKGQHTAEVLREYGFSDEEIRRLIERGAAEQHA